MRFGDPEAQVLTPRWNGDVAATLAGAASGTLWDHNAPAFSADAAVCVVWPHPVTPRHPERGARIEGLEEARSVQGAASMPQAWPKGPMAPSSRGAAACSTSWVRAPTSSVPASLPTVLTDMVSWPDMVHRSDIAEAAAEASPA